MKRRACIEVGLSNRPQTLDLFFDDGEGIGRVELPEGFAIHSDSAVRWVQVYLLLVQEVVNYYEG